jgi:threonine synthase
VEKSEKSIIKCQECNQQIDRVALFCPYCKHVIWMPPPMNRLKKKIHLDSMWSLQSFLPSFPQIISFNEGATPTLALKNYPDLKDLKVKLEFRNPTGSFRDRASSLIVSHAVDQKASCLINASTGSFSISLAAYCAAAKIPCISYIPQNLELSKVEQLQLYNSLIIKKGDSLEEAIYHARLEAEKQKAYRPIPTDHLWTIEGQKTISLEMTLQIDHISDVIVPLGSGSLIISLYRGFEDAVAVGWIKNIPRIHSVSLKETGSARLIESLEHKETDLLSEAIKIVKITNGTDIILDSSEMVEDAIELARWEGLFVEPASASVVSAAKKLVQDKNIDLNACVAILTGSGLNALNVFASQSRQIKKAIWGVATTSTTKYEILNLIDSNKANHGYAIWETLGKGISQQGIYQHLAELEQKGLIIYDVGERKKKTYKLTQKGLLALQQFQNIIDLL